MPKRSKRARHCIAAIQKRWDNTKVRHDEQESYSDKQDFNILWADGESEPLNDNQFIEELERLISDAFEQLIKKVEQPNIWVTKGRKSFYTGFVRRPCETKEQLGKRQL